MKIKTIKSLNDLIIGDEYFLTWGSNRYWKVVFMGLVNRPNSNITELLIARIINKKWQYVNMPCAHEIGIGKSKAEAKRNFGKHRYINEPNAYLSRIDAQLANDQVLDKYE
jgi:hypothetical protein